MKFLLMLIFPTCLFAQTQNFDLLTGTWMSQQDNGGITRIPFAGTALECWCGHGAHVILSIATGATQKPTIGMQYLLRYGSRGLPPRGCSLSLCPTVA